MPPFVPRKRHHVASPSPPPPPAKKRATVTNNATKKSVAKKKENIFDAIDAPKPTANAVEAKALLAKLGGDDDDDDESEASDDDLEFEDVPAAVKRGNARDEEDDEDEDDEMDWEDAIHSAQNGTTPGAADDEIGDLSISLNDDGTVAANAEAAAMSARNKKGPSKRERQVRIRTHCIHTQALIFHNAVRNSWLNDKELQKILVDGLSEGVKKEVDRYKIDMGLKRPEEVKGKSKKRKGKGGGGAKEKEQRRGRDWDVDAERLEVGVPNLSRGDPILRLLKVLAAYWKKRFTVNAPGIRKQGYKPLRRLADEIKRWQKDKGDAEEHGERIEDIEHFRKLAKNCEGSRDVGAQLFTALIRGLGVEARMVASLQPVGFGWSKNEEAAPKKAKPATAVVDEQPVPVSTSKTTKKGNVNVIDISDDDSASVQEVIKPQVKSTNHKILTPEKPKRVSARGQAKQFFDQDDSSELSSVPSDSEASLVDVTPLPASRKTTKKFDRDLAFPHYWTEVLSPISKTYIPVDSLVLSTVASNQELLATFEPRGKAADQAKQVISYVIAHNGSGTAKDVTIRYLKKHQMPGRTKGNRMPVERIPIHNKRGKIKHYEDYDWFKTVISPFRVPDTERTEADDKEEAGDLKPFKPVSEKPKAEMESLAWYKTSAEFVLERHLRREEAILPNAEPVKEFTFGKGDKSTTEPVYRRADVVVCKTVESWHKEGRQIKIGAQPLKQVPVRAVTLIRKREMEEAERETGEKLKQGLYSMAQTEWIIPPPIGPDRSIPKNAYGNMDVYVPSMVPKGAKHVRLKGTAKLCRKLQIDYAEACTGFEFGKQRAVPVIQGVVVAEENERIVREAWRAEEEEKRRKEDVKREAMCLHLWRKFVMGMRIVERMRAEYAGEDGKEEMNPFVNRALANQREDGAGSFVTRAPKIEDNDDGIGGGGFFLPGEEEAEDEKASGAYANDDASMGGGGFLLDDEDEDVHVRAAKQDVAPITPMSLQSAGLKAMQRDEDEDEDDYDFESRDQPRASTITKSRPPLKKQGSKAKAVAKSKARPRKTQKQKPKQKVTARRNNTTHDEDSDESDLSELVSASDMSSEEDNVRVVISAPRHQPERASARARTTKESAKALSVKSRFFAHDDDDVTDEVDGTGNDDDDDDDEEEEEESEEEVVKPRGTTARTRRAARG